MQVGRNLWQTASGRTLPIITDRESTQNKDTGSVHPRYPYSQPSDLVSIISRKT